MKPEYCVPVLRTASCPASMAGQLRYAVPSLVRGKLLFLRVISFW